MFCDLVTCINACELMPNKPAGLFDSSRSTLGNSETLEDPLLWSFNWSTSMKLGFVRNFKGLWIIDMPQSDKNQIII